MLSYAADVDMRLRTMEERTTQVWMENGRQKTVPFLSFVFAQMRGHLRKMQCMGATRVQASRPSDDNCRYNKQSLGFTPLHLDVALVGMDSPECV